MIQTILLRNDVIFLYFQNLFLDQWQLRQRKRIKKSQTFNENSKTTMTMKHIHQFALQRKAICPLHQRAISIPFVFGFIRNEILTKKEKKITSGANCIRANASANTNYIIHNSFEKNIEIMNQKDESTTRADAVSLWQFAKLMKKKFFSILTSSYLISNDNNQTRTWEAPARRICTYRRTFQILQNPYSRDSELEFNDSDILQVLEQHRL